MNPGFCFAAIDEDNQIVGLLGFRIGKNQLNSPRLKDFQKILGPIRGLVIAIFASVVFGRRPSSEKELLMDGLVVSAECRGQGIGHKLFDEFIRFAADQNFHSIRLDVIDENPRAKALYLSIGFAVDKHKTVPRQISNLIGVSGVTTMSFRLAQET